MIQAGCEVFPRALEPVVPVVCVAPDCPRRGADGVRAVWLVDEPLEVGTSGVDQCGDVEVRVLQCVDPPRGRVVAADELIDVADAPHVLRVGGRRRAHSLLDVLPGVCVVGVAGLAQHAGGVALAHDPPPPSVVGIAGDGVGPAVHGLKAVPGVIERGEGLRRIGGLREDVRVAGRVVCRIGPARPRRLGDGADLIDRVARAGLVQVGCAAGLVHEPAPVPGRVERPILLLHRGAGNAGRRCPG